MVHVHSTEHNPNLPDLVAAKSLTHSLPNCLLPSKQSYMFAGGIYLFCSHKEKWELSYWQPVLPVELSRATIGASRAPEWLQKSIRPPLLWWLIHRHQHAWHMNHMNLCEKYGGLSESHCGQDHTTLGPWTMNRVIFTWTVMRFLPIPKCKVVSARTDALLVYVTEVQEEGLQKRKQICLIP